MYHSNFLQQYILYNHLQASSYAGPTFLPATNKKTSPVWNVAGTVPNVCGILNYNECKAVIILGNEKVFSAGLNLRDLMSAKERKEVSLIF